MASGKLNAHLAEIDKQATDMCFRLVKELAEQEGITEALKAECQMEWASRINNIHNQAAEIVNSEFIYP